MNVPYKRVDTTLVCQPCGSRVRVSFETSLRKGWLTCCSESMHLESYPPAREIVLITARVITSQLPVFKEPPAQKE